MHKSGRHKRGQCTSDFESAAFYFRNEQLLIFLMKTVAHRGTLKVDSKAKGT